jgi:hypothetical protein
LWGVMVAVIRILADTIGFPELWAAHLWSAPFALGLAFVLRKILMEQGLDFKWASFAVGLVFFEPVFWIQLWQIGPETALCALLWAQWYDQSKGRTARANLWAAMACLLTLRGGIWALAIICFGKNGRRASSFATLCATLGLWQVIQWWGAGWAGFHTQGSWHWQTYIAQGIALFDVGRIWIWLFLGIAWLQGFRPQNFTIAMGVGAFALLFINPLLGHLHFGPRYLNPFVLAVCLDLLRWSIQTKPWRPQTFVLGALGLFTLAQLPSALLPASIAKPWDALAAHLFFSTQERALFKTLAEKHIPTDSVYAPYPLAGEYNWRWMKAGPAFSANHQAPYQLHGTWMNEDQIPLESIWSIQHGPWSLSLHKNPIAETNKGIFAP